MAKETHKLVRLPGWSEPGITSYNAWLHQVGSIVSSFASTNAIERGAKRIDPEDVVKAVEQLRTHTLPLPAKTK